MYFPVINITIIYYKGPVIFMILDIFHEIESIFTFKFYEIQKIMFLFNFYTLLIKVLEM